MFWKKKEQQDEGETDVENDMLTKQHKAAGRGILHEKNKLRTWQ